MKVVMVGWVQRVAPPMATVGMLVMAAKWALKAARLMAAMGGILAAVGKWGPKAAPPTAAKVAKWAVEAKWAPRVEPHMVAKARMSLVEIVTLQAAAVGLWVEAHR